MKHIALLEPLVIVRPMRVSLRSLLASSMSVPQINARSFKVALIQFGGVTTNKRETLERARRSLDNAVASKPDLVVLPEIFNSPYGVDYFADYAEEIPKVEGSTSGGTLSESLRMLSSWAKQHATWLVGGASHAPQVCSFD